MAQPNKCNYVNIFFTFGRAVFWFERCLGLFFKGLLESGHHIKSTSVQVLVRSTNNFRAFGFVGYVEARLVFMLHFFFLPHVTTQQTSSDGCPACFILSGNATREPQSPRCKDDEEHALRMQTLARPPCLQQPSEK